MAWTFRNPCCKFDNCDNAMNFRNNASNKCCIDLVVNYEIDFTKKLIIERFVPDMDFTRYITKVFILTQGLSCFDINNDTSFIEIN